LEFESPIEPRYERSAMVSWEGLLSYLPAAAAVLLGALVYWREGRHLAYSAFALGMMALAVREILGVRALDAAFESQALRWHRYRFASEAAIPGPWLLFAITFARAEPGRFVRTWRWFLAAAFLVPIACVALGWDSLVERTSYATPNWLIPVGAGGLWLHASLLLFAVAILVNLESTLRSAVGSVRWQIKFTVVGVGLLIGVQLFAYSQVLLYSVLQTSLLAFHSVAILIACVFVVISLVWRRLGGFDVYPSQTLIYNSLTLLVVGLYLLVVAGLVELINVVAGQERAPFIAFVVLLSIVGLALVLLSTELQQRVKELVNRHLKRPTHDYRRIWDEFTRRTSPLVEIGPLATAIGNLASETFGCSSASIWLVREGERKLSLAGSSALSAEEGATILKAYGEGRAWLEVMETKLGEPLDLRSPDLPKAASDLVRVVGAAYSVALLGGEETPIGFLTVNDRVTGRRYNLEDFALLKTFADQASATIRNRQLTKELSRAKEMETFQTLSTFFVHDLKNLASRFSLAKQNIPIHFDKPAFREDLLKTMEKSVLKIETMTARLSSLSKGSSLNRIECDMNALVREALAGITGPAEWNGSTKASLDFESHEVPPVAADPEEIQNVVTNLVLNAYEATDAGGSIKVSTSRENGWVLVSVSDSGSGMTREFIANNLFKPFQTTKKNGLGIGLYQSKTVVEAHGGRIEVESVPGRGTTFRVLLPSGGKARV
jgi:putative PEP-CTERM system histidine kinase